MWLLMLWWMNSKRGFDRWWATFSRSPVSRLSIATTSWPSSIRRSVRWLPINPAPPVISIRMTFSCSPGSLSPDSAVIEPGFDEGFTVENVAAVNHHLRPHHLTQLIRIKMAELFPFGDDHYRVAIRRQFDRIAAKLNLQFRVLLAAGLDRNRVVGLDARAHLQQVARNRQCGRVTQVIGLRLEGEPEQSDRLALDDLERLLQLLHRDVALPAVDVNGRPQHLRLVAVLLRDINQRRDVLAEA